MDKRRRRSAGLHKFHKILFFTSLCVFIKSTFRENSKLYSRLQVGSDPDHCPSAWHTRYGRPSNSKPSIHEYRTRFG